MADIAILVAEEFERRLKSCPSKQENEKANATADVVKVSIRKKFPPEKIEEFVNWVLEPKSQIGVAASAGFFSA